MKQEFKTVNYSGMMFYVPMWVNYITTDVDGCIKVFENEPEFIEDGVYSFWSDISGEYKIVYQPIASETSLVKLIGIGE